VVVGGGGGGGQMDGSGGLLHHVEQQPIVVRTSRATTVASSPHDSPASSSEDQLLRLGDGGAVFVHRIQVPEYPPPARPEVAQVTPEQVAEMQRLRTEDPGHWTQSRLAERYGLPRFLVLRLAGSAPAEHLARLEEERQVRHLRQVFADTSFERGGQRRQQRQRPPGAGSRSQFDQARTNRAKFRRMVEQTDGGLKAFFKQHNVVPKRPRGGWRPRAPQPFFTEGESAAGASPAQRAKRPFSIEDLDLASVTRPTAARPPTPEEEAEIRRSLKANKKKQQS